MKEDKEILKKLYRNDLPGRFNEFRILENYWDRAEQAIINQKLPPYEVLIHPSCTCNLRCKWCIGQNIKTGCVDAETVPERLKNPQNMLKVVQNICNYVEYRTIEVDGRSERKEYRVENVSFSGLIGEPLMAKESVLMAMKYLVNQGKRVGIFTNGLLIDNEVAEVFSMISYVLISLDAANNETYDKMKCNSSGTNNYDKVLNNIKLLNDVKKKNNSDLDINIGFVVNQYNYLELVEAAKTLKKLGVHYLRLKFDIAIKLKLNQQELDKVAEQIKYIRENIEDDYFKLIEIHKMSEIIANDQHRLFSKCYINKLFGAVGPDGCLYACNYHAKKGGIVLGDLLSDEFSNIWRTCDHTDVSKCPYVCDPFKNRANNMLNTLKKVQDDEGIQAVEYIRNEMGLAI